MNVQLDTLVYYSFESDTIQKIPVRGGQEQVVVSKQRSPNSVFSITREWKELVTSLLGTDAPGNRRYFDFLSLESGEVRRQIEIPPDAAAAFLSPNSQSIVFFRRERGVTNLWSQPVSDGSPSRMSDFHLARSTSQSIAQCAWSPNGKRFGLIRRFAKGDAVLLQEQPR